MKNLINYLSKKSLSLDNGSRLTRKWFGNDSTKVRLDSLSIVSRQSDLLTFMGRMAAILVLVFSLGSGNAWGATGAITVSSEIILPKGNTTNYSSGDWTGAGAPSYSTSNDVVKDITIGGNVVGSVRFYHAGGSGWLQLQKTNGYIETVITSTAGVDVVVYMKSAGASGKVTAALTGATSQTVTGTTAAAKTLSTTNTTATLKITNSSNAAQIGYIKITPKSSGGGCTNPTITAQPSGATYTVGDTPSALSVTASGTSLTYQWYSNTTATNSGGTSISGATSASYTPSASAAGTFYYYCVVSSGSCSTASNAVTITVNAAGGGGSGCDVLNREWTTRPSTTTYGAWSEKSGSSSSAIYTGNSAGGNNSIQLRSTNNSGIITTTSGGTASSVSVTWQANTSNGRTLNVYGKNTAYTATSDLYNASTQGDLLGTIVKGTSTSFNITGSYAYIGLRSNDGAMYLTEIDICWESCEQLGTIGSSVTLTTSGTSATVKGWTYTQGSGAAESNINTYDVYLYSDADSYASPIQTLTCAYNAKGTGVTFTGLSYARTYKVKIGATGKTNYCDITPVQVTTINSTSTQTFQLPCVSAGLAYGTGSVERTYGDAAFTNTLTNSYSVSVTYGSSQTGVATVANDGTVTIVGAGTTTITATAAEQTVSNVKYCAGSASYTLTVNKADISPTLTYTSTNLTTGYSSSSPTITGNTGSGAVTYSVTAADPSGCVTVDPSTGVVTANAAGTATVTATIAATDNYNGGTATANFTITNAVCNDFSFHTGTGTDANVKATNTPTCFTQVNSSTTWKIENYTIPSDPKFFVGHHGFFYDDNLGSNNSRSVVKTWAQEMYFEYTKNYGDGYRPTLGTATGAIGTLYISSNSDWNNLHVGFSPRGYVFKLGSTNLAMTGSSTLDAARYWETEVRTLTAANISGNYQVNLDNNTAAGRACGNTLATALNTMGVKSNAGDNWRATPLGDSDANTRGFFRIDIGDGGTKNWHAHFVPTHRVIFHSNYPNGSGPADTYSVDVSVEQTNNSIALASAPAAPTGYTWDGWYDAASGGTKVTTARSIAAGATADIELWGHWTPNTIALTLAKNNSDASGSTDGSASILFDASAVQASPAMEGATRTGYTVEGYYTDVACTASKKVLDASGNVINSTVSGYTTSGKWTRTTTPTTLYAKWTIENYTVTWYAGGTEAGNITTAGGPTTNVNYNNKVTNLPTKPDGSPCDKVFVGWTNTTSYTHGTSLLFTDAAGSPAITGPTNFYAVFATGGYSYNLVESDPGATNWAGDYLIAYSDDVFADGRLGGTGSSAAGFGIGYNGNSVDPDDNLSANGKVVDATWGDTYNVTIELISGSTNTYVLKTKDNKYNYVASNTNGVSTTTVQATAAAYPISITFNSSSDIELRLGGAATGAVFSYNTADAGYFRFYKNGGQQNIYLYKKTGGYSDHTLTCATCSNTVTVSYSAPGNGNTMTVAKGLTNISSGDAVKTCSGAALTVTLTPDTHYSVTNFTATGVTDVTTSHVDNVYTVTIPVDATGTLTITPTFTENARDTVRWFVAGVETKEVKWAGEALVGIEDPDGDEVCAGKTFMGWTADPAYFHLTDAPEDLFTDATTKTMPAGGTSYYAVFAALTGAMPVKVINETFDNDLTGDASSEFADNTFANFPTGNSKAYKGAYSTIKLGSGSAFGYITSKSLDLSNAFTVKVKAKKYGTDDSKIKVTVGSENHVTDAALTSDFVEYTFDFAAATASSNVKIETVEGHRAYIDEVQVITGAGTYTDWGVSCVTYEVTATTNNASRGTVSVSGYIITATPAVGCIVDGSNPYTVTSGTVATVVRDENTFKVVPTSDCTIRINFKQAATYTVTFYDNNESYTQTAYEETPFDLPSTGRNNCPETDAIFLGWVAGTYTDHGSGTSTKPDYIPAGGEVDITAATSFTAVYGVPTLSNTFVAMKAESELTSGSQYVIAAYYSSTDYAMKGTMSSSRVDAVSATYVLSATGNEVTNTALYWVIDIVEAAGKRVTLYNPDAGKYLSIDGSGVIALADDPFIFRYEVDESGSAATWNFFSPSDATKMLSFYTSQHQYNIYTSNSSNIYIYKQKAEISSYRSNPECCFPVSNPLTLTADMTTFVKTGDVLKSTLTTTGGNKAAISWTTTGGVLTRTTGTTNGLTLTDVAPGTYTVTATQPVKTVSGVDSCGATLSIDITVKAQWKIMLVTVTDDVETKYDSIMVTDGETYTLPDIGEDFTCDEGVSFAGWSTNKAGTSVEAAAGATKTATADVKWYAMWATAEQRTVPLYEKVTNAGSLAANAIILITDEDGTVALNTNQDTNNRKQSAVITNPDNANQIYFVPTSGYNPQELKLGGNSSGWSLKDEAYNDGEGGYLYAASSSSNHLKTQTTNDANGLWTISIADGVATITATGTYTHNTLKYNSSSSLFSCYLPSSTGQKSVTIYKKTNQNKTVDGFSETVTSNTNCSMSAIIQSNTEQWITAAKGQKVKRVYTVKAKGFLLAAATLSIEGNTDATHFTPTLSATAINKGAAGSTIYLTVEYTPSVADEENTTTITLLGSNNKGESVTKNLVIRGRSLPDEFLMITKSTYWYAVPANMNQGAGQYDGVNVTPDDATEPSIVPVAPSTVIYSLQSNNENRYNRLVGTNAARFLTDKGQFVRLAGNGGRGLWADTLNNQMTIQNNEVLNDATDGKYEWSLNTTDGVHYTITLPAYNNNKGGRYLGYGSKFSTSKEATIFFLVPAGCSSQPQNVVVKAKRVEATFSWTGGTGSYTIDAYTSAEMTGTAAASVTTTSSPVVMSDLDEETKYWYRITPEGAEACAVTGSFTTSGPTIDVVEWKVDTAIIFVDKDDALNPRVIIDGEVEHGVGSGAVATELFFAKYFEGAGDMKLLSIYNGTPNDIELDDYKIFMYCIGNSSNAHSAANDKTYPLGALGTIKAGQEIIFFTRDTRTGDITDAIKELQACTNHFMDSVAALSGANENPRWIECDGSKTYNGTIFPKFDFSGNDPLYLYKGNTKIDIFGAETTPPTTTNCKSNEKAWKSNPYIQNMDYKKSPSDPEFTELFKASSKSPVTTADSIEILGYMNINLEDSLIEATTARCILFRTNLVTSGDSAIKYNSAASSFVTFTSDEWRGRNICLSSTGASNAGVENDSKLTCNSYQDLGTFDYNQYYKDWTNIANGELLDDYKHNTETKTYEIPITDLANYSCLNLRFQLADPSDSHVITEAPVQVPIIVSGSKTTADAIFNEIVKTDGGAPMYTESINRCKTCNVVVLGTATLTKAADGTLHDVREVGDLKIYPSGKLIVPASTEYTVNSLSFRRQEDDVPSADIRGTLNVGGTKNVHLDMRVNPQNWHFFSLPFDCNVSDIAFVSEESRKPVLGTDYLIQWYDGERRAATKNDNAWESVKADGVLKKGLGYIFGIPGSGKVMREFRFPMSNDVIEEDLEDKTVSGLYGYGCDKTDEELRPNHKGWNLLGAPYLMSYQSDFDDSSPLRTGLLVADTVKVPWDGTMVVKAGSASTRYIVVPIRNGWDGYLQVALNPPGGDPYVMLPFTSYFVQIGGSDPAAEQGIEFDKAQVQRSSMIRRTPAEYEYEDRHPIWCALNMTNSIGEKDETTMLISDDFTDGYDMMNDLVKMRGGYYKYYSAPVLASRNSIEELAFNALPDASAAAGIPLNFFASAKGTYTIAFDDKYGREEIEEVKLLDNTTNEWHNLLADSYTFTTTKKEDNKTRFIVSIVVNRQKAPQITTGMDGIHYSDTPRKLLINGHIYIIRGNKVYDMTGKQVLNR